MHFVATTTRGAEQALSDELQAIGITPGKLERGAVRFEGELEAGYRACLWSRIASRVLVELNAGSAATPDPLYETVKAVRWEEQLSADQTLAIDLVGQVSWLKNSRFGMHKTKDAIVDRLRERTGKRPDIDTRQPDVKVNVHIRDNQATVAIDLSGTPLHIRSGGRNVGAAPMKETLAATMLWLGGWPELAKAELPLIDPMCGSGTLLIEAAGMALDVAPGFARQRWGFSGWLGHKSGAWNRLREEAKDRRADARNRTLHIAGFDIDPRMVEFARDNGRRAGVPDAFTVECRALADSVCPDPFRDEAPRGLLVANPPYGERLSGNTAPEQLYAELGSILRRRFLGWRAAIWAGNPGLGKRVGLKTTRKHVLHNGPLEGRLQTYDIRTERVARDQ